MGVAGRWVRVVLAVLAVSGVGAASRHSWRRVPLVLFVVRVVDMMVLLMWMVLQVLYQVMPRVRSLRLVLLRLGGGVASDAVGAEGAVGDAPGLAVAEVALLVVLFLMPVVRALQVMLRFTVSLVMMMMRVLQMVLLRVRVWAVFGLCLGAGRLCSRLGAWSAAVLACLVGTSDDEGAP